MSAPKIDYQLTPVNHRTRSTQIALVEIGRERISHAFKPDLTSPMYLSHSDTVTVLQLHAAPGCTIGPLSSIDI